MSIRFPVLFATLLLAATGSAATVTYTMTAGDKSASATFETLQNGLLQITLANTSVHQALSVDDVLTSLYFGVTPGRVLDPLSAGVVNAGSLVNCSGCNTTNVSAEWSYGANLANLTTMGPAHLITATSLAALTDSDRFGTTNVAGSTSIGGVDFGILPTAGQLNGSILSSTPVAIGSTTFILNPGQGFNVSSIYFAGFLYGQGNTGYLGTMQNGWNTYNGNTGTPEPGSFALLGAGLAGLALLGKRQRRARVHPEPVD